MTKTILTCLILSTCFVTACATNDTGEAFSDDDCRSLATLFNDQNLNDALLVNQFESDYSAEKSKDKFTWPWGKGGTNEDKVSKERAALRKAHSRKGCAQ